MSVTTQTGIYNGGRPISSIILILPERLETCWPFQHSAEVDVESEGRDTVGVRRMAMEADTMRIIRLMKSHWDLMDRKKKAIAEA